MSTPQADYYRLRTEWLRFKSQLFDGMTGLPALPAVLEDIRRMVEDRGFADVIYLDLGRSGGHETQLGWAAYDQAVREFARLLVSLKETGILAPPDIVCVDTVRSDRFLLFLGEGDPQEAGRTPVGRRERVVSALRERIDLTPPDSVLRTLRLAAGHARVAKVAEVRTERHDELSKMIFQGGIRTAFHPIVRLRDRDVVGHEALTRPLAGGSFDSVEELFAFAESSQLMMEFERMCRRTAIRAAAEVKNLGLLFLNASPAAVEDPEWSAGQVEQDLTGSGLRPSDVVVEITERVAIVRHDEFQGALKTFKERGYRVAVDDMGAGYASLQSLAAIEPDFLKFDVSLVRDIDRSSIKRSLLESLRQLAEKIHARVIAEGVERPEELQTLLELGIEFGQGYLFHREEPPPAVTPPEEMVKP
jgi:EAL domain-containing protein (putative c-di-GMP-specific phosphodiesterase class I)